MLATIWRADVQSSQAQQHRTAFRGGQTHLGALAGYGLRGEWPHVPSGPCSRRGSALPRAAPSGGTAGVEIEHRLSRRSWICRWDLTVRCRYQVPCPVGC